jgi:hypothetical protein
MGSGIKFNPEAISAALFTLLSGANFAFASKDRRGKIWGNVDPADQPYMGLIQTGATGVQSTATGLEKWTLRYLVLVYIRADANPNVIPATQINAALQAIAEAINSSPIGERQTLGGIVNNVWINGQCMIDTGILDQQCALLIPVDVELGV